MSNEQLTISKKIYISGKITGLDIKDARELFCIASHRVAEQGHTPINPMEIVRFNPVWEWSDYMTADVALLLRCDAIFMLSNWQDSRGARVEHAIAKELGMEITYETCA